MASIDYISQIADNLIRKYKTRNPYELCDELGIRIRLKDLGTDIKAYYFYHSRIRNIVINWRVSEAIQRILVAHELGHDRLHQKAAILKGFKEIELFDATLPAEFEANIFAAEILIDSSNILELLNNEDKSFFGLASELYVPAPLLDFKFKVLKHQGHHIEPLNIANGDFLKSEIISCLETSES